jgi:hypothetical protein
MLCCIGHALMDEAGSAIGSRNPPQGSGLIVQGDLTQAGGHAERRAALDMIHRHPPGSTGQPTLGADKGFDAAKFVADLRQACVTPHVAQRSRFSAIGGRTTRHKGYALSIRNRNRIEEPFGWAKTAGGMAQTISAASNGCIPAPSSQWPPTPSPGCQACWPHGKENRRQADIPRAWQNPKPNP